MTTPARLQVLYITYDGNPLARAAVRHPDRGVEIWLREHADLLPESVRFKPNAAANPIPPTLKRRGRPPKNGGADHPNG
jgi:hypothetical protein